MIAVARLFLWLLGLLVTALPLAVAVTGTFSDLSGLLSYEAYRERLGEVIFISVAVGGVAAGECGGLLLSPPLIKHEWRRATLVVLLVLLIVVIIIGAIAYGRAALTNGTASREQLNAALAWDAVAVLVAVALRPLSWLPRTAPGES